MIYEVFRQERKGQAFAHAGSVEAPNEEFAEWYAREEFGRRGESVALWVVPREAVHEIDEFVDELGRNYHRVDGYPLKEKLKEDVAFSSIAQNEVGHARALYQLVAEELGTTADDLAFDRRPEEYRCSSFVELRLVPDWAKTIARHCLYEDADERRIKELIESDDPDVAGLAAKIDREEAYHRMHARMWFERLQDVPQFQEALEELRPMVVERGEHLPEFEQLWEEMTEVRRSVAGATW